MLNLRDVSIASIAMISISLSGCDSAPSATLDPEREASETTVSDSVLAAASEKEVQFVVVIELMKGHLNFAKELVDDGQFSEAASYLGTTLKPLYGGVQAQLQERDIPAFNANIDRLLVLLKTKSIDPQVASEYEAIEKGIDLALNSLPVSERQSPQFLCKVMNRILNETEKQYKASISDSTIVETIAYQKSRASFLSAETVYRDLSEIVQKDNPKTDRAIAIHLDKLKTTFPSPDPPEQVVLKPAQVSQVVKAIAKDSEPLN
jgi:CRISPR/Cas system CSM-associated protein Csm2 small subunit